MRRPPSRQRGRDGSGEPAQQTRSPLPDREPAAQRRPAPRRMLEALLCCGLLGGVAGHAQLADVPEQGEIVPGGHVEAVGVAELLVLSPVDTTRATASA